MGLFAQEETKVTEKASPFSPSFVLSCSHQAIIATVFTLALGTASFGDTESETSDHWAFQPIQRSKLPTADDASWPRNAIDLFVLAKLEEKGIKPSPEAPRTTLIRRLYLDLVGLPPLWERVAAFVEDSRPNAYELLVDELLASPRYGERWGRHWLDLARYADSTGYESDKPREIWAYRDWVINALNADMPFDQFVTEQLAGDLLPDATIDQRIATGFHCNAMLDPGVRHESIIDRVNTTGAVFLGLTTGCAQCHSHKTDPLTQRDFYQLYAFFNEATITEMPLQSRHLAPRDEPSSIQRDSPVESAAQTTLVMKRTPQPTHIFIQGDHTNPGEQVAPGFPEFFPVGWASPTAHDKMGNAHTTRLDLAKWLLAPDNPLTARVTANRVWQRFFGVGIVETENDFGMQTPEPIHRDLLDHLASELRVGEVERSELPAPKVPGSSLRSTPVTQLSWRGLKSIHRLIVISATYRQSSDARRDLAVVDPANQLLARQQRIRLEAEVIRDVALDVGGMLSHRIGGPSVFPHQAEGILQNRATPATWEMSKGEDRYRRGLYTWVWRLTPHPNLPLFDAPDGVTACTRRDKSNIPVQALTLLNDPSLFEASQALADRVRRSHRPSDHARLGLLMQTCLGREPSPMELSVLGGFLRKQHSEFAGDAAAAAMVVQGMEVGESEQVDAAAWVAVSRVVMNLDEFITRE